MKLRGDFIGGYMIKKKRIKSILLLALSLIMSFVLVACGKSKIENVEPISKSSILLDTPCKVTVYDQVSEEVLDKAFDKLKEVDRKMNASDDNSEIGEINKNAGKSYVKVSEETFYVIKKGIEYGNLSKDAFDITIGPLVKLWGINTERAHVPDKTEINSRLPLVNYRNVSLKEDTKEVMLRNPGMSLDLGGIAKGYAADAVSQVLKDNGVEHAIIDLGGNILTMGSKVSGEDWKVGVQNPDTERGQYIGIVEASNKTVVTTGIYERYFEQDGKRYHHILDTKTGYPVDNNLASVSIITDKSIDGDALAKAFCMGIEKGMEYVISQGAEGIFVTKDSKVYLTNGLKDKFKLTDNNFKVEN